MAATENDLDIYFTRDVNRSVVLHLFELEDEEEVQIATLSSIRNKVPYPKNAIFNTLIQLSLDGLINGQGLTGATGIFTEDISKDKSFVRLSNKGLRLAEKITQTAPFEEDEDNTSPLIDVVYDEESGDQLKIPVIPVPAAKTLSTSLPAKLPAKLAVPAANRYVSSKDNQEVAEIIGKVSDLIAAINEARTNDFGDKEGRIEELLTLDFMLKKNQICVPLVEEVMRNTVQYLAVKFSDVAIGQIALQVLKLAANAFGIQF